MGTDFNSINVSYLMITTYESAIKNISSSEERAFNLLGNLTNLKKITENPEWAGKCNNLQLSEDACAFTIDGIGQTGFRVIEREPYKTIKLQSENSPIHFDAWIQLKQAAENDTRLKLTLKADIPTFVKFMIDKKLTEGINIAAEILAKAASTEQ
jgi:hypothetical protein